MLERAVSIVLTSPYKIMHNNVFMDILIAQYIINMYIYIYIWFIYSSLNPFLSIEEILRHLQYISAINFAIIRYSAKKKHRIIGLTKYTNKIFLKHIS